MNCSLSGSSVHWISQAKIGVSSHSFSRGSSWPRELKLCHPRSCGNGVGKKSCLPHYSAGWNTGSVQICVLGRYETTALSHRWPVSPSDSLHPSLLGFPFYEPLVASRGEPRAPAVFSCHLPRLPCCIWPSRMSSSSGFHPTQPLCLLLLCFLAAFPSAPSALRVFIHSALMITTLWSRCNSFYLNFADEGNEAH